MKKTVFILFLFSVSVYSQTLKAIIKVSPLQSVGDSKELMEKAKQAMYYSYVYSKGKSFQMLISKEETTIDTILTSYPEIKDEKLKSTQTNIRAYKTIYFKDYKMNIYRMESSKLNENLLEVSNSIKDSIPTYNWKLLNEYQTISGFNCKKAITNRNFGQIQEIVAWYCEDIPINDGPMDFNGLPGLILQIEIGSSTIIKVENVKLLDAVSTDIEEPKNETKMLTITEYIKKMVNGG